MQIERYVSIRSRFSLAIYAVDAFTGEAPVGADFSIAIQGYPKKPVIKADGAFIFTDLPNSEFTLYTASRYYLQQIRTIRLDENGNPTLIVHLPVQPSARYPFSDDTVVLRGMLRDKRDRPVADADVFAHVNADESVMAVVAQDEAQAGADSISLRPHAGKLHVGAALLLKQGDKREYIEIAGISDDSRTCSLNQPLKHAFERGAVCLPGFRTRSDSSGEIAVPFRHIRVKPFSVSLTASSNTGPPLTTFAHTYSVLGAGSRSIGILVLD